MLWTRLASEPLTGGGMEPGQVEVHWEIAHDEDFHMMAQKGSWERVQLLRGGEPCRSRNTVYAGGFVR